MQRTSRTAFVALAATLAIQMFTSLAATAPAVLAPELSQAMGVAPQWIGVFVGFVYAGRDAGAASRPPGFIERYGAIRVSQVCVLLCAVGICLVGLLPATLAGLLLAVRRPDRRGLWTHYARRRRRCWRGRRHRRKWR